MKTRKKETAKFTLGVLPHFSSGRAVQSKLNPLSLALQNILLGLAITGSAYAQQADPVSAESESAQATQKVTTLPVIRVEATELDDGYVAKRSTTGTKTDTPIIEIPQSISVIGRDEMEARGALDMLEAIRYTPSILVNNWGVENRGIEWVLIRGFNAETSYADGLLRPNFGTSLSETYGLERVELLRGPASVMFGQAELGGISHRISKQPTGEAHREVTFQYGSFDRKQLALDVGDRLNNDGSLAFRLVGLGLKTNSNNAKRSNGEEIENDRLYFAPSLRWQPTVATSLTVLGEVIKNNSGQDGWVVVAPDGKPTTLNEGDPNYSKQKVTQSSIGYLFEHQINDRWVVKQNFRQASTKTNDRSFWSRWEDDERTLSRTATSWQPRENQTALDTQLHSKFQLGITQHTLLFGVDWNRSKKSMKWLTGPAPSFDRFTRPVVYGVVPEPTDLRDDYTQTTQQLGVYAQDQVKIDQRWIVTLGGRYDRVKTTTDDRLDVTNSSSQSDNAFSGRAGLNYLLGNGWAPYVSYAESFLPTSGVDANDQPFKPSEGKQVEVGIKYQPEGTRTSFTAAVFDLRKSNVVTRDDITRESRQIGKIRSRGIELEAKAELMRGLNATAAYTRLDMEVLESADATERGKTPRQVPEQTASVWLDYKLGGGFGLGGGVRYVGSVWNDKPNTSSQPSYTLADAALRYDLSPWQLALNVSNLLDKEYVSYRSTGNRYFKGAERNVVLSMKYNW